MSEVQITTTLDPQIQIAIEEKQVKNLGIYSSATTVINKIRTRAITTLWSIIWNIITLSALITTFISCLSWLGIFSTAVTWIEAVGLIATYALFEANYIHSIIKAKKTTQLLLDAQDKEKNFLKRTSNFLIISKKN